jgi:GNAT superfamily N-acetyltransferase
LSKAGALGGRRLLRKLPGAQFPVGEFGNQPVGRLCLARWTREIRVIDIALIPAARGQGIGGALLRQIIDDGEQLSRR